MTDRTYEFTVNVKIPGIIDKSDNHHAFDSWVMEEDSAERVMVLSVTPDGLGLVVEDCKTMMRAYERVEEYLIPRVSWFTVKEWTVYP